MLQRLVGCVSIRSGSITRFPWDLCLLMRCCGHVELLLLEPWSVVQAWVVWYLAETIPVLLAVLHERSHLLGNERLLNIRVGQVLLLRYLRAVVRAWVEET